MRFYGLKTCDTCRKARSALEAAGHDLQVTDVRADGVPAPEIARIVAAFGDRAVNRASATWRALAEADRALPTEALLAAHPTVMKRPVIEAGGAWHLGWGKDVQAALLGKPAASA